MPLKKYLDYDGLDYLIQRIPRTKIKVTFDDVFAGETATCSMGTTTYTKTVPATEPYELVFPVNELGIWTIATSYLGDDYGTTIEVTAIGQTATGHVSHVTEIDGATVEPTDDITTWLKCANIEDPSVTTLADVLANRSLFETLIANSNACKYMARSTTWALAEGAVPTLVTTSSNVISSGDYSGQPAWKVFDGDNSTPWSADAPYLSGGAYVGYKFDTSKNINSLGYVKRYESASSTQVWKVQGSSDGTDWIDLSDNFTVLTAGDNDKSWHYINFTNANSYSYYRVYEISNNNNSLNPSFMELQFYEADITRNQDAMALIGKYDYCSDALLSNATWAEAIANSDYFEEVLNVKVPVMTSNTAPSGECIASGSTSGSAPWYCFRDTYTTSDTGQYWQSDYQQNPWIGYKFPNKILLKKYFQRRTYQSGNSGRDMNTVNIQASNDGINWVNLATNVTINNNTSNELTQMIFPNNSTKYQYFRIYEVTGSTEGTLLTQVQFYGRASAQTNIIHSAPNDTIYMLENGSQVVLTTTDSDGIGILDFTQFMDGTYTLYSSVAKDPDNLSNDYSKSIRITKTSYGCTTEAYLIPDGALYWYGNECLWKTGGWDGTGYSYNGSSNGSLTKNTRNILLNMDTSASATWRFLGITNAVNLTAISKISFIGYINDTTLVTDAYADLSSITGDNYIAFGSQRYYSSYWDNNIGVNADKNFLASNLLWTVDHLQSQRDAHKNPVNVYAVWLEE